MAVRNLTTFCDFVVADTATTAGTGDTITSDAVYVGGADSVVCIVELGTVTSGGTANLQVTDCATSGGSYADISGATTGALADKSNKMLIVEVIRPKKPYIKIDCDRATANVVIKSMIAIVQRNGSLPCAQTDEAGDPVVKVGP